MTRVVYLEERFEQERQVLRQEINALSEAKQQADLLNRSFSTLLPNLDLEHSQKALELCVSELHTALGCAGILVIHNSNMQMRVIAQSGLRIPVHEQALALEEKNPFIKILTSRQAVAFNLGTAPFTGSLSSLNQYPGCMGLPIGRGEAVFGALVVFDDAVRVLNPLQLRTVNLYANLLELILKYSQLSDHLRQLRVNDELTNLPNRASMLEIGQREVERARRYSHPLCLLLLDLDDFGQINSLYGQQVGNQILQSVARLLRSSLREADVVFRSGGDEFAVLLPETPITHYTLVSQPKILAAGRAVAERLRKLLVDTPIDSLSGTQHITACIGISEIDPSCQDFAALLHRSETALHNARQLGHNQAQAWHLDAEQL